MTLDDTAVPVCRSYSSALLPLKFPPLKTSALRSTCVWSYARSMLSITFLVPFYLRAGHLAQCQTP